MFRLKSLAVSGFAIAAALNISFAYAEPTQGEQWWAHVKVLADDNMEGRLTGSPGYLKAADYVITQMKALGLKPAGTEGFLQPVAFVDQAIVAAKSRAVLTGPDGETTLSMPEDVIFSGRGGPAPEAVDAPLVFVGYGLQIPEAGYDDFKGVDLKGKIAVVIGGGPKDISAGLKSHARSERPKILAKMGAVGTISLTPPKQVEIPWSRSMALSSQSAMYLANADLRDVPMPAMGAAVNPAKYELLFAGSGHSFAELAASSDESKPIAGFPLATRFKAEITAERHDVTSPNVVAVLPGSDPVLKNEYIVLSAHLDHLGVGTPIKGDAIYNGALDNASGVASLIEIAKALKASKEKPKRSVLFVFVCAEEKGLLGSRYFASRPTVPQNALVADINFDMALTISPITALTMLGADENTLGADAEAVSKAMGLPLIPDSYPDRNLYVRSDQYSFIKQGIPSLALKIGIVPNSPEDMVEKAWRTERYHAPSDDINQPVLKEEAAKLIDYTTALTLRIANAERRPAWNANSFFKRFEKPQS